MSRRRREAGPPPRNPFDPCDGPIDSTLDLHGATAIDVEARLKNFLETAVRRHPGGLVHVITGRGRSSLGAPVLKPAVKRLLAGDLARLVTAAERDENDGGYLVRLKR